MASSDTASLTEHFGSLVDPRIDRTKRHKLIDILVIALCGTIAGADSWVDVRGGLVCLNSAARFDKWNRAAVR